MKYKGEKIVELVSGHGELWSARMLTTLFQQTGHAYFFIDARKVRMDACMLVALLVCLWVRLQTPSWMPTCLVRCSIVCPT